MAIKTTLICPVGYKVKGGSYDTLMSAEISSEV